MLVDKDIVNSIIAIKSQVHDWFCAPLSVKRGASHRELKAAFDHADVKQVAFFYKIDEALQAAQSKAKAKDRIIIFGSFHTVAQAMKS